MKKTASLLILSIFLMLLILSSYVDLRVHANNIAVISYSESSYLVAVNKPFNVTIMVENVSNLDAWQIAVLFDPNIMQYVTSTAPSDNVFGSEIYLSRATNHLSEGLLYLGGVHLPFEPSFNGSGKLITVTFIMKTLNTTTLGFDASYAETFLLTLPEIDIQHSVVGSSVRSVQYMPDVNNDGIVDMKDIVIAVIAFNSFPSTSRWNVYADVDGNERVDMKDIVLIVPNFGLHTSGTPSGGSPGIEKLEFISAYAETVTEGWNLHLVIRNTGSVPAMFDNSRVYIHGWPAAMYTEYAPVEDFGQVTLQPGNVTELRIMLPAGAESPWQHGLTVEIMIVTIAGNVYWKGILLP